MGLQRARHDWTHAQALLHTHTHTHTLVSTWKFCSRWKQLRYIKWFKKGISQGHFGHIYKLQLKCLCRLYTLQIYGIHHGMFLQNLFQFAFLLYIAKQIFLQICPNITQLKRLCMWCHFYLTRNWEIIIGLILPKLIIEVNN